VSNGLTMFYLGTGIAKDAEEWVWIGFNKGILGDFGSFVSELKGIA
jgi:hypothetical protein